MKFQREDRERGRQMREGYEKRPFSNCRYCIPIHQAALLSRAEPGVSRLVADIESIITDLCTCKSTDWSHSASRSLKNIVQSGYSNVWCLSPALSNILSQPCYFHWVWFVKKIQIDRLTTYFPLLNVANLVRTAAIFGLELSSCAQQSVMKLTSSWWSVQMSS